MSKKHTQVARRSALALVLLLVATIMAACNQPAPEIAPEVARPVKVLMLGSAAAAGTLEVPGSVYAAQSADLAFEVSGRMLERMVEEGQEVAAGEIVARLDSRDYIAQRDQALASRNTRKADYDRYAKAFETNAVTEQQVSRAKGLLDIDEAQLTVARKALDDTELKAPFAGRIARRLVDDFANVQAKEPVMVLQDESSLELRVDIAERDWIRADTSVPYEEMSRRIRPRVEIASLADRVFPAYIKELSATADSVTRTYRATVGFENPPDANVSPGMTGKLIVDKYDENAGDAPLSVPSTAVVADEAGNPHVWLIDEASMRVSRKPVELGELAGGSVAIERGLAAGDRIAISGVNTLTEGMLIRLMDGS